MKYEMCHMRFRFSHNLCSSFHLIPSHPIIYIRLFFIFVFTFTFWSLCCLSIISVYFIFLFSSSFINWKTPMCWCVHVYAVWRCVISLCTYTHQISYLLNKLLINIFRGPICDFLLHTSPLKCYEKFVRLYYRNIYNFYFP